jgi:NADPH2:quinone reductase
MLPALPAILGNGVGGTVVGVGDGVDGALLGERVVASLNRSGGYAEYAVTTADALIHVPDELATDQAVALLADGRTAMVLTDAAAIQPGDTVLVEAAAGGVGSLLVQRARGAGARVVAAVGGPRKVACARKLGADVVVDYTIDGWDHELGPNSVDVVFDGVGGRIATAAFALVRAGGRFCAFGMSSGAFVHVSDAEADLRGVRLIRGFGAAPADLRKLAAAALDEAVQGRWRPLIGQTFSLDRAAQAHAAIEQRATIGKTLLLVR